MKTIIIYMSHHGTTHKVAQWLQERLNPEQATLVNLKKDALPDLSTYSTILIGGSIHMGKIQKRIRNLCIRNMDILLQKRVGLFLCYMDIEHGQKEFDNAFPLELRNHAVAKGLFGGELLFREMNFMEKFVTKSIMKNDEPVEGLNVQNMMEFANRLKAIA